MKERVVSVRQLGSTAARTVGTATVVSSKSVFSQFFSSFESGGITKHLMTGPSGDSEFCFPRSSIFAAEDSPRGTLRFRGNIACEYSRLSFARSTRWESRRVTLRDSNVVAGANERRLYSQARGNKTHSFLWDQSLSAYYRTCSKLLYIYSETPPCGHLVDAVTSLLLTATLFWPEQKLSRLFSYLNNPFNSINDWTFIIYNNFICIH